MSETERPYADQHDLDRLREGPGADRHELNKLPSDPWAHRGQAMKCSSCMAYVAKAVQLGGTARRPEAIEIGRCRRHAPTMAGFPAVFPTDWCLDHKIDESKL